MIGAIPYNEGERYYKDEPVLGSVSLKDVMDLQKALTVDYGTDVATFTGGQALRVQSLENVLHIITFREPHLVLWREIEKEPAYSTVEEYSRILDYGGMGGTFLGELETPEEDTTSYDRQVLKIKFMGKVRSISIAARLVRKIVDDLIGQETFNGSMALLRDWTWAAYWGDSKMARGGVEGKEFDGIIPVVMRNAPMNVLDAEGNEITDKLISTASELVASAFGEVNRMFVSTRTARAFFESYYGAQRVFLPSPSGGLSAGFIIKEFQTVAGDITIIPDRLLKSPYVVSLDLFNNPSLWTRPPKAPDTTITVSAAVQTGPSQFSKGGVNNCTVRYLIFPANEKGLGNPVATSDITGLNDNRQVVIQITEGSGQIRPEFFVIFRRDVDSTGKVAYGFIARVPASSTGTTSFTDVNDILPGSEFAVLGDFRRESLVWASLLDLVKVELPILGQSIPWMLLMYGGIKFYNPKWLAVIKNINYQRK